MCQKVGLLEKDDASLSAPLRTAVAYSQMVRSAQCYISFPLPNFSKSLGV